MNVCGIIAEYNPLHNGHRYHLSQARKETQSSYVVVAMSGSFTQRGEPAVFDKWARARWALLNGADLVVELPALYCLQSAEFFARGGVKLLHSLGVVTHLCFGSELADAALMTQAAHMLEKEPPDFRAALEQALKRGCSYPRARFEALREIGVPERMLTLLSEPNGILGVEYIRAIERYAPEFSVAPLSRVAVGHHATQASGEYASATAVRSSLLLGRAVDFLVPVADEINTLIYEGDGPVFMEKLDSVLLHVLRTMSKDDYRELPDAPEGLESALRQAALICGSSAELLDALKSKRYTRARLSRLLAHALLSIRKSDVALSNGANAPGYIRVLGMRKDAQELLTEIKNRSAWPLISRKAEMDALKDPAAALLRADMRATDMQALGKSAAFRSANQDYTRKIVVI